MRHLGIILLVRILIIEAKAEQIRTNTFFVLQVQNVRENVVCCRGLTGFPVVGKPFTTVLVPPSILEWSDTCVEENLADHVLCFFKMQLLHVGLLIEKDPLQQGWLGRNPWGNRRMGSLVKQCFTFDTLLLLLPFLQIRCHHCVMLGGRNLRMIPYWSINFLISSTLCTDALSHTSSIRLAGNSSGPVHDACCFCQSEFTWQTPLCPSTPWVV